jgi:hypothetical protein
VPDSVELLSAPFWKMHPFWGSGIPIAAFQHSHLEKAEIHFGDLGKKTI